MEFTLTKAQYEELKVLMIALQNPISQAGTTSVDLEINATKIEYSSEEVKIKLSPAE